MGDTKKRRKKFSVPFRKWDKSRIEEESKLIREYGLKNKKEVWKESSKLADFKRQAKRLVALKTGQAEKERKQLLDKLKALSLLPSDASMDNILDLGIEDILERRLQTIVFKKGLARSVKAARQFITHGHITVDNVKVTVPSYLVRAKEEGSIRFSKNSSLFDSSHPERFGEQTKKPKKKKNEKTEQ